MGSSTLVDPWTARGETLGQLAENTVSQQRRRARFEFSAGGFDPYLTFGGGVITGAGDGPGVAGNIVSAAATGLIPARAIAAESPEVSPGDYP